jgi:F-type H+-transporting ATPase subunit b
MVEEHARMLEEARKEQAQILRDATDTRNKILAQAKDDAREEAAKILAEARTEIEAEKEAALRDVRKEVAVLSVSIAEKILRKELSEDKEQREYIDRMVEETVREQAQS